MVNVNFYRLQMIKEKGGRYDLDNKKIKSPGEAYKMIKEVFDISEEAEEVMILFTLNTKNVLTGVFEVSRGILNSSMVHPREIFKRAIINNSSSIMLFHNHPSGDTTPSKEDISITTRLLESSKILGIPLLDHIIIGNNGFTSLKEEGVL